MPGAIRKFASSHPENLCLNSALRLHLNSALRLHLFPQLPTSVRAMPPLRLMPGTMRYRVFYIATALTGLAYLALRCWSVWGVDNFMDFIFSVLFELPLITWVISELDLPCLPCSEAKRCKATRLISLHFLFDSFTVGGLEKWSVEDTRDSLLNVSFKHFDFQEEDVPEVTVYIPTYDGKESTDVSSALPACLPAARKEIRCTPALPNLTQLNSLLRRLLCRTTKCSLPGHYGCAKHRLSCAQAACGGTG